MPVHSKIELEFGNECGKKQITPRNTLKKKKKKTKKEKGKNKEKKGTKNFEGQTFLKNRKVPF